MLRNKLNFKTMISDVQNNLNITNRVIDNMIADLQPVLLFNTPTNYKSTRKDQLHLICNIPSDIECIDVRYGIQLDVLEGLYLSELHTIRLINSSLIRPNKTYYGGTMVYGGRNYWYVKSTIDHLGNFYFGSWEIANFNIAQVIGYKKVEKKVLEVNIDIPSNQKGGIFMIRLSGTSTNFKTQYYLLLQYGSNYPESSWRNYADLKVSSPLSSTRRYKITVYNMWNQTKFQSEDIYEIHSTTYGSARQVQMAYLGSSLGDKLPYQIEFQKTDNAADYFRIYNLDPAHNSLSLVIKLETFSDNLILITEYDRFYNLSIKPQEPNFIYGEKRWYDTNSNKFQTFNHLASVENCSPLVEECVLCAMQDAYQQPKSIKVSKKYAILNITSSYRVKSLQYSGYYNSILSNVIHIPASDSSFKAYDPIILGDIHFNSIDCKETDIVQSVVLDTTNRKHYVQAESKLVYDGDDAYNYYFHIEYLGLGQIADNIIKITGINSRKKNFS